MGRRDVAREARRRRGGRQASGLQSTPDPGPPKEPSPHADSTVSFTDERLPNGLRLVIAEDHLAPVVAVNIWYDVGSKHEVAGKTGFAHLFEHVMFQGSRNVAKAEHIALVQAAGGTMNGTTWLDRTNYFETVPSHQLELAIWLEADRMGTLLDALSQENLDNQREVVKNEKRWSYDNRPYGSWNEKLQAHLFPPEHPYHHTTIGSMEDLDAASVEDVSEFFRTYYAPNNAVLTVVGDVDPAAVRGLDRALLRGHPGEPVDPAAGRPVAAGDPRRGAPRDRLRQGPAAARLRRVPGAGLRRPPARRARHRLPGPRRRQGQPSPSAARPRGADRPGRRAVHARLRRRRVDHRRLGDGPAGRRGVARRGRVPRGAGAGHPRAGLGRRAGAGEGADRERRAGRASPGSTSGPTGSRCTRRCSTTRASSTACCRATWPVTADDIQRVAADVFRPDNRVVLTYLPELPPADASAVDGEATEAEEAAA